MLELLTTSKTRRKILGFFTLNPSYKFYLRQIASEVGEAVNAVRFELLNLERGRFVVSSTEGNRKYFQLNEDFPYLKELKVIVKKMRENGYKEFCFTDFKRKRLLENNLRKIVDRLIKIYQPQKIILFGSLATGNVLSDSDLDILIIKETKKKYYDRLKEVTQLCDYSVGVDFLVYTPAEFEAMKKERQFVREEIVEKGKVVYEQAA